MTRLDTDLLRHLLYGLWEESKSRYLNLKIRKIMPEVVMLYDLIAGPYRLDWRLLLLGRLRLWLLLHWLLRCSVTVIWWSNLRLLLYRGPITV